jgi:hypothetical protein
MMNSYVVEGFYGSGRSRCDVLVHQNDEGSWYCVRGSENVNLTLDPVEQDVDVETLSDIDCFGWSGGIDTLLELVDAVDNG